MAYDPVLASIVDPGVVDFSSLASLPPLPQMVAAVPKTYPPGTLAIETDPAPVQTKKPKVKPKVIYDEPAPPLIKSSSALSAKVPAIIGSTSDVGIASPEQRRKDDFNAGVQQYSKYFGFDNPYMKGLLSQYETQARDGLSAQDRLAAQERGSAGINSQLGTNLRAVNSLAAARGVKGGAVTGMALPALTQATQARSSLESGIESEASRLRQQGLDKLTSLYTGERGSLLSAALSNAMLGAGDRQSADQLSYMDKLLSTLGGNIAAINSQQPVANAPGLSAPAGGNDVPWYQKYGSLFMPENMTPSLPSGAQWWQPTLPTIFSPVQDTVSSWFGG